MLGHIEVEVSKDTADRITADKKAVVHIGNEGIDYIRLDVILSKEDTENGVMISGFFTEIKEDGCYGCAE